MLLYLTYLGKATIALIVITALSLAVAIIAGTCTVFIASKRQINPFSKRRAGILDHVYPIYDRNLDKEELGNPTVTDIDTQHEPEHQAHSKNRLSFHLKQDDSQDHTLNLELYIQQRFKKLTALSSSLKGIIEHNCLMQVESQHREEIKQISEQLQQEILKCETDIVKQLQLELADYQRHHEEFKHSQFEQQRYDMSHNELKKENAEAHDQKLQLEPNRQLNHDQFQERQLHSSKNPQQQTELENSNQGETSLVIKAIRIIIVLFISTGKENTSQSRYFNEAKSQANIPFLHHQVLECDSSCQEFYIEDHDITLTIPEGAVTKGRKLYLEVGVAMYGPFIFSRDVQPVSPILWLCPLNEDFAVNKPFQIKLPHYLTGLSTGKLQDLGVGFMKANHAKKIDHCGKIHYKFQDFNEGSISFISNGFESNAFGIMTTKHCCFYCIKADKSPLLSLDATYYLIRIENSLHPQYEVHFAAIYYIKTCLKVFINCIRLDFNPPLHF